MAAKGWEHADLVKHSGESSSVVSQWLGKGSKEIKSIGKLEAALNIEAASGYSALWVAKGKGPKMAGERFNARSAHATDKWPFERLTAKQWERLKPEKQGLIEGFALGLYVEAYGDGGLDGDKSNRTGRTRKIG